jgi:hypothetical protein
VSAQLSLIISAVDRASATINQVDSKVGKMGKTFQTVGRVAAVGMAAGLGVAVVAGVKFVKAAAEEEKGIKRLAAAVDANGGSWAKHGKEIERQISQRQKLAFSDDQLRSSLAMLTAQTGSHEEGLRRQIIAMDLARGANIDLGLASKLLGKVTDDNVNVLARYGIRVRKGADATEMLGEVQKRFAGQSAAYANTAAGRWERFNIAVDNIKESIGTALLPLATKLATKLATFLEEHQEDIDAAVLAWNKWAEEALPKIERFVDRAVIPELNDALVNTRRLIELLEPKLSAMARWLEENQYAALALGLAFLALTAYISGPLIAIPALTAAGVLLLANWDDIEKKAKMTWPQVRAEWDKTYTHLSNIPVLGEIFNTTFEYMVSVAKASTMLFYTTLKAGLDSLINLGKTFKAIWEGDWAGLWANTKAQMEIAVNYFDDILNIGFKLIKELVVSKIDMVKGLGGDIGKALGSGLVEAFTPLINWVGNRINDLITAYNSTLGKLPGAPDIGLIDTISERWSGSIGGRRGGIMDYHQGGMVPGPLGAARLAVVHGGERVLTPGQQGGVTVNLTIQTPFNLANPADQERAALQIAQLVRRQMRFA